MLFSICCILIYLLIPAVGDNNQVLPNTIFAAQKNERVAISQDSTNKPNKLIAGLPALKISENKRYLVTSDGLPFFWLGDTAWELIHRLTRDQIDQYLEDRAKKGFTIIQTVILAELDGLKTPNAEGYTPLIDNDPTKLSENYFSLVDHVVNKAEALGLYVGLLPTWGDKFNKKWGQGPEIFTPENAEVYGTLLAQRYAAKNNIVWILGGDRLPEKEKHFQIVRGMARGIKKGGSVNLMTYHPAGAKKASDFFDDPWLDFDMYQSGHSHLATEYSYVEESFENGVIRPIINGEARYENIRDRFWEDQRYGWLDDADVRVSAYWSMLAGAAGYTYGCNDIWQMYDYRRDPIIGARTDWFAAMDLPGASHMTLLKRFFEAVHWYQLLPDQGLIANENEVGESYQLAARGLNNEIVVAYTPVGQPLTINLSKIPGSKVDAFWYNPRSGSIKIIGQYTTEKRQSFTPWSKGWGSDFLLVLIDAGASDKLTKFTDLMK